MMTIEQRWVLAPILARFVYKIPLSWRARALLPSSGARRPLFQATTLEHNIDLGLIGSFSK